MRKFLAHFVSGVLILVPAFVESAPLEACPPQLAALSVTSKSFDSNYRYSAWELSKNSRLVAASPGGRFIVEGFDTATMNRVMVRYVVRDLIRNETIAEYVAHHQEDDSFAFQFFSPDELGISWREAPSMPDSHGRERRVERLNVMTGERRPIPMPPFHNSISDLVTAEAAQNRVKMAVKMPSGFDERLVDTVELSSTGNHAVLYVNSGAQKGYHLFNLQSGLWMRHFKPRWTFFNGRSSDQIRLKLFSGSGDFIALDDQILDVDTLQSATHRWSALAGKRIVNSWFNGDDLIVVTDRELISLRRSDREGGRVLLNLSEVYLR